MNDINPYQSPTTDDVRPTSMPLRLATGVGYVLTLLAGIGSFTAALSGMEVTFEQPSWGMFAVTTGFGAASFFCWRLAVRIRRHLIYLRKSD